MPASDRQCRPSLALLSGADFVGRRRAYRGENSLVTAMVRRTRAELAVVPNLRDAACTAEVALSTVAHRTDSRERGVRGVSCVPRGAHTSNTLIAHMEHLPYSRVLSALFRHCQTSILWTRIGEV